MTAHPLRSSGGSTRVSSGGTSRGAGRGPAAYRPPASVRWSDGSRGELGRVPRWRGAGCDEGDALQGHGRSGVGHRSPPSRRGRSMVRIASAICSTASSSKTRAFPAKPTGRMPRLLIAYSTRWTGSLSRTAICPTDVMVPALPAMADSTSQVIRPSPVHATKCGVFGSGLTYARRGTVPNRKSGT